MSPGRRSQPRAHDPHRLTWRTIRCQTCRDKQLIPKSGNMVPCPACNPPTMPL